MYLLIALNFCANTGLTSSLYLFLVNAYQIHFKNRTGCFYFARIRHYSKGPKHEFEDDL
jgi:hypothetical protein